MAPKRIPGAQPHAGHALGQLAQAAADAHDAIGAHEAAVTAERTAALELARASKAARRADRLAAIEQRNKHAADHPVDHAGG